MTADGSGYNEAWLQTLVFQHPELIPVEEIDNSYEPLVPICLELNTPAGPLDVLYATPKGRLVLLEAKLWRNPEARRKVIGQILDYAKELSLWSYEELSKQVSLASKGETLFQIVKKRFPDVEEQSFTDEVARSLQKGRFLLLILGDGIREGAGSIAAFLERAGNLQFSFGLVEVAVFEAPGGGRLVQPRTLAKTVELSRTVVELIGNTMRIVPAEIAAEEAHPDTTKNKERKVRQEQFWKVFLENLRLDDQSQPFPRASGNTNMYFSMPNKADWVAAWTSVSGEIGVYLTFTKGPHADAAYKYLLDQRNDIEKEIGFPLDWESKDGKHIIVTSTDRFGDPLEASDRGAVYGYLGDTLNRFINAFRGRLARFQALESSGT